MILLKLFWSFVQIGFFSFGGGMASLPLVQNQVVDVNHWMSLIEFTDLITIAQMTPGPIAINSATFVGIRIAGIAGALIATLGCILPSCIIVFFIAWMYGKYSNSAVVKGILSGLRPAVVALIASAGITLTVLAFYGEKGFSLSYRDINFVAVILFAVSLFVLRKYRFNPIFVMLSSGIIGGIIYLII